MMVASHDGLGIEQRIDAMAEFYAEVRIEIREMTVQLSEIVASLELAAAG